MRLEFSAKLSLLLFSLQYFFQRASHNPCNRFFKHAKNNAWKKDDFILIELLIVVSIIIVLNDRILPDLIRAKGSACKIKFSNNEC